MPPPPLRRVRTAAGRRLRALRRRVRRDPPIPPTGVVEEFTTARVSGWVSVPSDVPGVAVSLLVNGSEIARTEAAAPTDLLDPGGTPRSFRFLLGEIWDFLGPADRITVAVAGRTLPIVGRGTAVAPAKRGPRRWRDLRAELAAGKVFSRNGALQRPLADETEWQAQVFGIADRVGGVLHERFGLDVFLTYGTLLGAVREGGAIAHDDDLDLGYLSRHTDPAAVGQELYDIARTLLDLGWTVEPFGPLLHAVETVDGVRRWVDVFPHFFDDAGRLHVPWGMAGTAHVRREQWTGLRESAFGDYTFAVPVAADALLAQLYGDGWRRPQPGFSWPLDRTEQRTDAHMPRVQQEDIYWRDFHSRTVFTDPSPFCRLLLERPDCPAVVVDLGCGDGRDAAAFAATGRKVLGLERAPLPLQLSRARPHDTLEVVDCDITDPDAVAAALHDLGAPPALFYLRFVIHLLSRAAERSVLESVAAASRPGDLLALEFRDLADRPLTKNVRTPFRGYRDGRQVVTLLAELGFDVEQADHATGRSPWGLEDPDLWRIVARRR